MKRYLTSSVRWVIGLAALVGLVAMGYPVAQGVPPFLMYGVYSGAPKAVAVDASGNFNITATVSGADGAILDGVSAAIKATVLDLVSSNPLTVAIVDSGGAQITSFGGGTQYTQDAALTVATSVGTMALGRASAAVPTDVSADNDAVMPWYLRSGAQATVLTAAGALIGGDATNGLDVDVTRMSGQFAEDAIHSSGDLTTFVSGIRRDTTPTSSSGAAGDYSAFNLDGNGRLYVQAVLYNSSGTELVSGDVTEDAAETAGGTGPMVLGVRRDVAASSSGTTGDNSTFNLDALGLLWTRSLDPCNGTAKTAYPINISTATTTEITPSLAGASTNYYVCAINLVVGAADNVALVDDDTDNCPSVTSGLAGGTTAASGWNFAANGGLTQGNGDSTIMKTNGTNRVLCLVTSAAAQVSGTLMVVAAP